MASPFIAEFQALPSTKSRREALGALIEELTPHEWRALHSVTSARTFDFDIIGHLPVELATQIFSHLDTSTPYRLQSVRCIECHF